MEFRGWRLRPSAFLPALYPEGPPLSVVSADWVSVAAAVWVVERPASSRPKARSLSIIRVKIPSRRQK